MEYDVYRNAVIKGFELVLETGGKLLGKYLKQFFSSPAEVDRLYFKDVLRHTAKHGLLTPDEVRRCFFYRDNRNLTAHDYGETPAEEALRLKPSQRMRGLWRTHGQDRWNRMNFFLGLS